MKAVSLFTSTLLMMGMYTMMHTSMGAGLVTTVLLWALMALGIAALWKYVAKK